nr:YhcN/YlaJ family sporulation lipoprotein [Paenibacillus castaneae]
MTTKSVPNNKVVTKKHDGISLNNGNTSTYNQKYNHNGNTSTYHEKYNRTNNRSNITNNKMNAAGTGQEAKQLVNRAELVSGVKKATVVVNNNDAIVGIDVDNTGKKAIIEKQVHSALKTQYPQYNIHVTSDPNLHERIRSIDGTHSMEHPVKTLGSDVTLLIRDIGNAVTRPFR